MTIFYPAERETCSLFAERISSHKFLPCVLQTLTASQGTTQRPSRLVFTDVAKALNA